MGWSDFVVLYLFINVAILGVDIKFVADNLARIAKTVMFIIVSGFLFDYIANDRELWGFPRLWGIFLSLNPVENTILMIGVTLNIINLNRWARRGLSSSIQRAETKATRHQV